MEILLGLDYSDLFKLAVLSVEPFYDSSIGCYVGFDHRIWCYKRSERHYCTPRLLALRLYTPLYLKSPSYETPSAILHSFHIFKISASLTEKQNCHYCGLYTRIDV